MKWTILAGGILAAGVSIGVLVARSSHRPSAKSVAFSQPIKGQALPRPIGPRCALVIATNANALSKTAEHNARQLAGVLESMAFKVQLIVDAPRKALGDQIDAWTCADDANAMAVVYYAGHAVETNGRNFLVPAGVPESALRPEALIDLDRVIDRLRHLPTAAKVIFLDACRDEPERRGWSARLKEPPKRPPRTLVMFATGSAGWALDEDVPGSSPFASALLAELPTPGINVTALASKIAERMFTDLGALQIPSMQSDEFSALFGDVYFRPPIVLQVDIVDGDDDVFVLVNKRLAALWTSAQARSGSIPIGEGDNVVSVLVYNQHTFVGHNSLLGAPEGWRFDVRFRLQNAQALGSAKGAEDRPAKDGPRHGRTFVAACTYVTVDARDGSISVSGREARPSDAALDCRSEH